MNAPGSIQVFHRSGVLVTLPVPSFDSAGLPDYRLAHSCVDAILAAGFLPTAPGLEAGETVKQVGYVVRRSKEGRNGDVPVVDLYEANDGMTFAFLAVYLNTPEEVAAFNRVSGMDVMKLPLYIGDNKIERRKSQKTDALVVKVPRPFGVVYTANPKFDQAAADAAKLAKQPYKIPSRKFVRWDGQPAQAKQDAPAGGNTPQQAGTPGPMDPALLPLDNALKADPDLSGFNNLFGFFKQFPKGDPRRVAAWDMVVAHATTVGWTYDSDSRAFVRVQDTNEVPY